MLGTSFEYDLVDVSVECFVGEVGKLLDVCPVIVHLIRVLAEAIVLGVVIGQNTGTASMQPKARVLFGVASENALCNGFGGTLVIGSICGIFSRLAATSNHELP